MIQDIINSIVEAEEKADRIIKDASSKAKDIRILAEINGEKLVKQDMLKVKESLRTAIEIANKQAIVESDKILELGSLSADELLTNSEKDVKIASEFIARRIVEKYGNS